MPVTNLKPMIFVTALLLIGAAQSTMAAKQGLRGVPRSSSNERELKGGKGGSCTTAMISQAPLVYCENGQTVQFSFRSCAYECVQLPLSSPQNNLQTLPQTRSVTPATPATPQARKGGKGSSALCQYHDNQLQNPMIPCADGEAVVFNHKDCAWVCKQMPTVTTSSFDTVPQPRSVTPVQATTPVMVQATPTARKSSSKLCQYQDNQLQNPMIPCSQGQAAVFNHKDCKWMCKQMPAAPAPAPVESGIECPQDHIPVFDYSRGGYECLAVPDIECPPGQHIAFDNALDSFYCAV